jgi:hypothetical protein
VTEPHLLSPIQTEIDASPLVVNEEEEEEEEEEENCVESKEEYIIYI